MAHLDVEFPRDIAAGCQAVLERRDEVVTLASGHEETNQRWVHSRRMWNAGLGIRSRDDLALVLSLFEAARGRAHSFAFRDWLDWRSNNNSAPVGPNDQRLGMPVLDSTEYQAGVGNGSRTVFQVVKGYGAANPYRRPIALPHAASLRVAVDGVEMVGGWSLSATGGVLTFDSAPAPGAVPTAGYTFDVPVRFAESSLAVEWAYFDAERGVGAAPDITLIEKRLDGLA